MVDFIRMWPIALFFLAIVAAMAFIILVWYPYEQKKVCKELQEFAELPWVHTFEIWEMMAIKYLMKEGVLVATHG